MDRVTKTYLRDLLVVVALFPAFLFVATELDPTPQPFCGMSLFERPRPLPASCRRPTFVLPRCFPGCFDQYTGFPDFACGEVPSGAIRSSQRPGESPALVADPAH